MHLSHVRETQTLGEICRTPHMHFDLFERKYEEPDLDEGYIEIVEIDFIPYFKDEQHEEIFKRWTY